jgi:hypothetical protein
MSNRHRRSRHNGKQVAKKQVKVSYGEFQFDYVKSNPLASQAEINEEWAKLKAAIIGKNKALNAALNGDKAESVTDESQEYKPKAKPTNSNIQVTLPSGETISLEEAILRQVDLIHKPKKVGSNER